MFDSLNNLRRPNVPNYSNEGRETDTQEDKSNHVVSSREWKLIQGMLKKAASGVLWLCQSGSHRQGVAVLPYSRTMSTLRASKRLRLCWTDFFEHSLPLKMLGSSGAFTGD